MENLRSYWNDRYAVPKRGEASASGTFTHLDEANRWFYQAKFDRVREILRENGIALSRATVLDAACGTGAFIPLWLSLGAVKVIGLDLSDAAVERCRSRFATYSECGFEQLDLGSQSPGPAPGGFDLVCIFEAIFLLTQEEQFASGLRKLCSWVKPGGHLLLTDQMPETTAVRHERLVYHSRATYEKLFAAEGMELVGKVRQSCLFNRHIFPEKFQLMVESKAPWLLYGLNRLMLRSPWKNAPSQDEIYYCLARKRPQVPS
jgi:SAM-dependent methyltransferase